MAVENNNENAIDRHKYENDKETMRASANESATDRHSSEGDHDSLDGRRRSSDKVELNIEEDEAENKVSQKQSNSYAAKKTVAQGMMDIALITANANQLRFIIEFNSNSSTFYLNVCLIVISLILQIAVGVSLIFKGRLDLRGQSKHRNAKLINNYVVVGVFLVTIINVFIASFTITGAKVSDTKQGGEFAVSALNKPTV